MVRNDRDTKDSLLRISGPDESGAVVFLVENNSDRSKAVGPTRLAKRLQQGPQADSDVTIWKDHKITRQRIKSETSIRLTYEGKMPPDHMLSS